MQLSQTLADFGIREGSRSQGRGKMRGIVMLFQMSELPECIETSAAYSRHRKSPALAVDRRDSLSYGRKGSASQRSPPPPAGRRGSPFHHPKGRTDGVRQNRVGAFLRSAIAYVSSRQFDLRITSAPRILAGVDRPGSSLSNDGV